ncbi:MAG: MerR family transcriptional regulator [Verrucomicrobiales bacterium]|nr:MerR family transcriptional regulator [Verrucomicrobiales bacterium]MBP9224511.1 MerR family transcriptional regulator [Verrucomicrobiales bacterium]
MMKTRNQDLYEISAVARLTGISPHVLRVWERRYGVVEPQRSDSKRRRYSADDIQRLCLIKSLVDHGHAISTVAGLQLAQLEEREAAAVQAKESEEVPEFFPTHGIRIAVIGTKVRQALRSAEEQSSSMRVVGEFLDATELIASLKPEAADLVVVERDTLFPEDVAEIQELIATLQVKRAIVVYQFAREETITSLAAKRIAGLRAPVDAMEIRLACLSGVPGGLSSETVKSDPVATPLDEKIQRPPGEVPERIYRDEQLVRIAQLSSVVNCECPQHLANLLSGLVAFERYSEQCEDRDAEDAAIHAFLHHTTAKVRSSMEIALSEVLAQEGITI